MEGFNLNKGLSLSLYLVSGEFSDKFFKKRHTNLVDIQLIIIWDCLEKETDDSNSRDVQYSNMSKVEEN